MLIRSRLQQSMCAAMCLTFASACADDTSTISNASTRVICEDCVPVEPGKGSSSSIAEVPLCDRAFRVREVDADEAEALGFEVRDSTAKIEEPIDAELSWVALNPMGGAVAAGYEAQTRVLGQLEVESYRFYELDPALCDGTECKVDGRVGPQSACIASYLMLQVSGVFETRDGAIIAKFPAQPTTVRRVGEREHVVVAATADLSRT